MNTYARKYVLNKNRELSKNLTTATPAFQNDVNLILHWRYVLRLIKQLFLSLNTPVVIQRHFFPRNTIIEREVITNVSWSEMATLIDFRYIRVEYEKYELRLCFVLVKRNVQYLCRWVSVLGIWSYDVIHYYVY